MTLLHNLACLPAELEYRPWIQEEVTFTIGSMSTGFPIEINMAESSSELLKYRTLINAVQQFRCWYWHRRRRPGM